MSEVERFCPKLIGSITFLPDDEGEWVKASDYDALKEYTDQIESAESLCADVYESLKSERDALANSGALVPVPVELSEWYMTPTGLGWWGEDKHGMPCVETPEGYHDAADCYPVRLVPIAEWEAEG